MDKELLGIRKGKLFYENLNWSFCKWAVQDQRNPYNHQTPQCFYPSLTFDARLRNLNVLPIHIFFFSFFFLQTYPQFPSRFKHRWLPYCDRSKNATLMFNGIKNPLGSNAICCQLIVILEDSLLFENMGSFYMLPEEQYEMSHLLEKVLDWVWQKISHKGDNTY